MQTEEQEPSREGIQNISNNNQNSLITHMNYFRSMYPLTFKKLKIGYHGRDKNTKLVPPGKVAKHHF